MRAPVGCINSQVLGTHGERRYPHRRRADGHRECAEEVRRSSLGDNAAIETVDRWRSDERGDDQRRRRAINIERRAELLDLSLLHDRDAAGHGHCLHLIVGDVEHGRAEATLEVPADNGRREGGRGGSHTEHLSYLLAEMQVLHRAHPGAKW